jgi:uncharacterized protein (TIGR02271 family)
MNDRNDTKKGAGAGAAGGAVAGGVAGGAAAGAAAGGMTGPVGAAIGAAVGAGIGAASGGGAAAAKNSQGGSGSHGASGSQLHTVIGAFDDRSSAERAVERLASAGFARHDIHLEHRQASPASTSTAQRSVDAENTGGGGFLSWLFGDDDGQSRPSTAHAHTYDEAVRRGAAAVVVDVQDEAQADRACSLLHELGAIDVDERAKQWRAEGWKPPATGAGMRQDVASGTRGSREGVLDVVEEELQVGKRSLDRGGVRVVQRVSSKPVREMVRLREEHAVVERRAVNRPATGADLSNFKEGTLEIRETAEEPVVAKTARVVEEVRVGKEVREREEAVEDTVRRKDVEVERLSQGGRVERERAVAADPQPAGTRKVDKDRPL